MTELNFEEDVAIDLDDLHEEWRSHSQIRYKYASEVAHLDKVIKQHGKSIDVKKSQLKKEESRITIAIKTLNPKATVQQIDAELILSTDAGLKNAQTALSDAEDEKVNIEYNLNMAKNALKAFDDRKTALENEVTLWTRNYFATPREERMVDGGKRILMMQDRQNDETAQGQRKELNKKRVRKGDV